MKKARILAVLLLWSLTAAIEAEAKVYRYDNEQDAQAHVNKSPCYATAFEKDGYWYVIEDCE